MTLLLLYLAIAIGVSFLCSILEAVLLSITPSYSETIQSEKPKLGAKIAEVRTKLDESLSSILILNTFAHTMGAAGVGSQAVQVYGAEWETLIAVLLTLAILYFSEIIPKTLGATYWRQLAVPASFTISWLVKIVFPLVWLSTRLTKLFSKDKDNVITRDEILALASLGQKDGTIVSQENEYLSNLLHLREVATEEILTPRSVVHMLPAVTTIQEALDDPQTRQFTRIPVYDEHVDDVIGQVIRADLYEAERQGKGSESIVSVIKPLSRVSDRLPVQKLLDTFIKKRAHLFLVTDEFGQNEGVVSLEDAIETLLGREIMDETDAVEDMQALARSNHREKLRETKAQSDAPESNV
ncbi:transporter [Oleiphilus sp. HI0009]|nr:MULTISPECIES: CNNM domain-containing protein [unclassified Oleiphilus]KZX86208.1 transporter [Oleiphilus sp. HI0009]MCH2157339.1 CNNM domain-containing protein [Oleiphilaceae bacterium]KZY70024.1 transporter [Oleiphilus sp. HI0066]KZY72013.1 transporter [Oleiphilus sp. HI0067]KZZ57695.1 transporter [Oleiphilus sp. HI0125]